MWIVFGVLSAVFAALTLILAKVGIDGGELELGDSGPNGCGCCDVVADGICDE